MSLKGIGDFQQKMIAELIHPYMYIETTLKKKSIALSKETLDIIKQAKSAFDFAEKNNLHLPKSTYNIVRYGPAIIKIFNEIEKYAKYEKVKKRIKRVVQYAHVIVWDKRAIEIVLKNSDKPKIKTQDDEKIFKQFLNEFTGFKGKSNEEKYNKYRNLFVAKNNAFTEHFNKGDHYLKDYNEKLKKLEQLEKEIKEINAQKQLIEEKIHQIEEKIKQETEKFYSQHKTGTNIASKRKQLSELITKSPLSGYLKILGELVDTFDSYATKQEIVLSFEVQGALQALKDDLVSASVAIDQGFNDLVDQFIRYHEKAFGKKRFFIKFLRDIGGEKNLKVKLATGPGYNAWYDARQINKDVQELQKTQDYKMHVQTIELLEKQRDEINEGYHSVLEKSRKISQDIADLNLLLDTAMSHLEKWQEESKFLI